MLKVRKFLPVLFFAWLPYADAATQASAGAVADSSAGDEASPRLPAEALAEIALALIAIVVLICVIGWLVKRFSGLSPHRSQFLKTIAVMPLGSRERIAVIEVGQRQIVVGITPSQITTLLELDKPLDIPPAGGEFARKLQSLLHRDQNEVTGEAHGVQKQP